MPRKALIAAVIGLFAVLGSCVPLGQLVSQMHERGAPRVLAFDTRQPLRDVPLTLTPGRRARVAMRVTLEARDGTARSTAAAPLTLRVADARDRTLLEARRDSAVGQLARGGARLSASGDGQLELHFDLPRFVVPADGRVRVSAALPAERRDGAVVRTAEVVVNDAPDGQATGFTAGVFMLLAGWIAAVAGGAMLLARDVPAVSSGAPTPVECARARRAHLLGLALYPLPCLHLVLLAHAWWRAGRVSAFVEEHAREALNFQLSVLVYLLVAFTLSLAFIGLVMLPLVLVFQLVMLREAATQARRGHRFRYPLTFRFVV